MLGDFRLQRLLARGGMAAVWEAQDASEDRRVALKVISCERATEEIRARFEHEVRALKALAHPNVVPLYGAGEADGHRYIAMRLIEGESLSEIIDSARPLELGRVLRLVGQIASGLDAVHERGLIHGDLKPSNVMVEHPGQEGEHCYLIDFGLVAEQLAATTAGSWAGTPSYVSPEQLRGEVVDDRADLYALGVLAFNTLTGQTPFEREHDSGTLLAQLYAPPPSVSELRPDVPRQVDEVLARALSKTPGARHTSAGEFHRALVEAAGSADSQPGAAGQDEIAALVGRRGDLEAIRRALEQSRLVSIVGPGGAGKTALAIHLDSAARNGRHDVWSVELTTVGDGAGLELAIARTLGLRIGSSEPLRAELIGFLAGRRALLVLDNCEHLLAPTAELAAELITSCPGLSIVATSRERLSIDAELVYPLAPLAVPAEDDDPEDVFSSAAAELLLRRAAEGGVEIDRDPVAAGPIARICARLEGLPLALELAASRLRTLTLDELDSRLAQSLGILEHPRTAGPARAQTLDGMIEWSWRLLEPHERQVLTRLAVLAGSFTPEAAEAVAGPGLPQPAATIVRLTERSLLQVEAGRSHLRLRMLQPVREFCLRQLDAAQARSARVALRMHLLALAERAQPELDTVAAAGWLATLDAHQENVRVAIETGTADGDSACALRLGIAMRQYWACRGRGGEGVELLTGALARIAQRDQEQLRARAHSAAAHLAAGLLGDTRGAEAHGREALRLARISADSQTEAEALVWLSWSESFAGRPEEGLRLAGAALAVSPSTQDPAVSGRGHDAAAMALEQLGRMGAARSAYGRALRVFAGAGHLPGVALVENHLGDLELGAGDLAQAAAHFARARSTAEAVGDGASVAMAALNLALIDHLEGHAASARELFVDALLTNYACGDRANIAFAIFGLALTDDLAERAAELHGCATARLEQLDIALSPLEERLRGQELERLTASLGDDRFAQAFDRGRRQSVEEVLGAIR